MTDDGKQPIETSKSIKSVFKQLLLRKEKKLPTKSVDASSVLDVTVSKDVPVTNYPLFVGKYDYSSRTDDDLGFKKGDLLYVINKDDDGWWYARSKHTGQEGYIPSNYVLEYNPLDAEE